MTIKRAIVVTTINYPTLSMRTLQSGSLRDSDMEFHIIGDSKSPDDFYLEGSAYFSLSDQKSLPFSYAKMVPERHYARKNIGYLTAAASGCTVIIETDDDNCPTEGFWDERTRLSKCEVVNQQGWCNVYQLFSTKKIWPRGLPLQEISCQAPRPEYSEMMIDCPIQQGLADSNPDVDAIYRLILPLPVNFEKRDPVALAAGVWCPFNSQNTTFFEEAFPLLYLPYHCSFRMTDIWRSFVAQRLCWVNGWSVMFHNATVEQDRNEHDLMRDFADEVPGYLHNDRIRKTLEDTRFETGVDTLPTNIIKAYEALVKLDVVGRDELPLLRAWLDDLRSLAHAASAARP